MAVDDLATKSSRAASGLKVSAYDRSSSLLIAMLLLAGASVLGILIVFFSSRLQMTPPAIPFTPVALPDSFESEGDTDELTPGLENAPDVSTDNTEMLLEQLEIAADEAVDLAEEGVTDQATASRGDPRATGVGRTRRRREARREIRFDVQSMEQYAQWFDRAGLEIGVLGSDNLVYYASNLSSPSPQVRTGDPAAEKRLYFNSRGGPLYPLDKELARRAGIADKGVIILQFCTESAQNRLLGLEAEKAGDRPREQIAYTAFRVVVESPGKYDFVVEEQQYTR